MKEKIVKQKQLKEDKIQTPVQQEQIRSYRFSFLHSPYTLLLFGVLCLTLICLFLLFVYRSLNQLQTTMDERIREETERNAANLELMETRLIKRIEAAEQIQLVSIENSSEENLRRINRLNSVYLNLLDAQKRRTLESFYNENALTMERREAAAAFTAGRYVTANRLYEEISTAHPEDQEARFYQYYALFLNNKMNRDNYPLIREAMNILERQGYSRRELTETLDFINKEAGMDEEQP